MLHHHGRQLLGLTSYRLEGYVQRVKLQGVCGGDFKPSYHSWEGFLGDKSRPLNPHASKFTFWVLLAFVKWKVKVELPYVIGLIKLNNLVWNPFPLEYLLLFCHRCDFTNLKMH